MNELLHSSEDLIALIEEVGFLPLFKYDIPGFSVEEHTRIEDWWTKDPAIDPWTWRMAAAKSGRVAYGKFFRKKSGFISKEWFPSFANFRRDGYDFDSLFEDGKAKLRCKKLMDLFEEREIISSIAMKEDAGFGKGGEKNFNGILTELQMQMYLTAQDFHRKVSKKGEEYGMYVGYYATPEYLWGYDYVTSCYKEDPEESRRRVIEVMTSRYPEISAEVIKKALD